MKNWYLATYKKADGTYGTALVLSDSEAKAEEHFKDYDLFELQPKTRFTIIAARVVRL